MTVERLAILLLLGDRGGMGFPNAARLFRELPPAERASYLTRAERELVPPTEEAS